MNQYDLVARLDPVIPILRSKKDDFPFNACESAGVELAKRGLIWVKGMYRGHFDPSYIGAKMAFHEDFPVNVKGVRHDFSYDLETGFFIDITARQFDVTLPEILLIHFSDPRIAYSKNEVNGRTTHQILVAYDILKHGNRKMKIVDGVPVLL